MNIDLSIVIPAYNEAKSISPLTELLSRHCKGLKTEVIFVDDGSSDSTYRQMVAQAEKFNKPKSEFSIKAISLLRNSGKSAALTCGISAANGRLLSMMDADLQDDPAYLKRFIAAMKHFDLVIGNRVGRYKNNSIKKISSRFVNYVMRKSLGYEIHDMNCGYKVMKIEVARHLYLKTDYHRFIPLLAMMTGYRVGEVEIKQRSRRFGKSKYGKTGLLRGIKFMTDFLSLIFLYRFSEKPFKLFGQSGIVIFLAGFLISLYLSIRWLMGHDINGRPLFFSGNFAVDPGNKCRCHRPFGRTYFF